jgi:uncharacterized OB-fold protein
MTDEAPYPLPQPTVFTTRFWQACQSQVLEIPVCLECDHLFLPGGPVCPKCWSAALGTREVSGSGSVFSYVIYHRTYHPSIPAPYVVAIIELDEGVRLVSNIIECEPGAVFIGMQVEVVFQQIVSSQAASPSDTKPGFNLPKFRPLGEN